MNNITKYKPFAGSSYIKLTKELDQPRKGQINIQNTNDTESIKWCLVRYLNPADHHPARITKADKDFAKKFDSKDKIPSENQRHSQKLEKKEFYRHWRFWS